jgi:hypothetical protein
MSHKQAKRIRRYAKKQGSKGAEVFVFKANGSGVAAHLTPQAYTPGGRIRAGIASLIATTLGLPKRLRKTA